MRDRTEKKAKPAAEQSISKGRLEFLFDGVFAIAMTILVLELRIPELADDTSSHELGAALLANGRIFISYIFSFLVLSMFWLSHNRLYPLLEKIGKASFYIHSWLLALAAFVPFCAHLINKYNHNRLAIQIYFAIVLAYEIGMLALSIAAKKQKLLKSDIVSGQLKKIRRQFLLNGAIWIVFFIFFSFFY